MYVFVQPPGPMIISESVPIEQSIKFVLRFQDLEVQGAEVQRLTHTPEARKPLAAPEATRVQLPAGP